MKITNEDSRRIKLRLPKKQSLFNKFSCKLLTAFLFFIPPFLKKKKLPPIGNGEFQGQPYVIHVENNTAKEVRNVKLFGSYEVLSEDVFDKSGNYIHRGVKISSAIPDLSYQDVLCGMNISSFVVSLTYVMSMNQKQILSSLRLIKKSVFGDLSEDILISTKDPYQQQTNIVALKKDYKIDGLTSLVIPILQPNAKATYYFYPTPLAYSKVKIEKQSLAFRFFKSISEYFKKEELVIKESKPITIQVSNFTDEVKKDVSIFGAYKNLFKSENARIVNGSLVIDDVLISSSTPNVSYAEMLYYTMNFDFKVVLTYIWISDGDLSQICKDFKIKTQDDSGNLAQKTIIPRIDPYQQQNDVLCNHQKFTACGHTEFIITELQPKTTVVYQFYPEEIRTKND